MTEPLEAVHGIGRKTQQRFVKHAVRQVSDLTLHSVDALHAMVDRLASPEEVGAWQRVALLAQVNEVDLGRAEALARTGIDNISELSRQSLSALRKKFKLAMDQGLVDAVPSAEQCCAMIQDATVIDLTGSLSGRVRDPAGKALGGVSVIAGAVSTTTDDGGYFRLIRLPFSAPPALVIKREKFQTMVVENPVLGRANEVVVTEDYVLQPRRGRAAATSLSELKGDTLPPLNAYRMRTRTGAFDDIEDGDILVVSEFYESSPDAKLVSRFKIFEDGEFFVRVFKVPVKRLPRGAELRDLLQFEGGKFKTVRIDDKEFLSILLTKRAINALSDGGNNDYDPFELFEKRFELAEEYGLHSGFGRAAR